MIHYYIDIHNATQLKNNLQKELSEWLNKMNGSILVGDDYKRFIEELKEVTAELNEKHRRCKPIQLRVGKLGFTKEDWHIFGFEQVDITLRAGFIYKY